jgi:maltose alpha-D-glucosyltransferase/alpha-amylase
MDPVYGFQANNVEAELRNPSSQLHWMKRMLEVRKQHALFGAGRFEVIPVDNPSVLAYVRTSYETPPDALAGLPDLSLDILPPSEPDGERESDGEHASPGGDLPPRQPTDIVLCVCNLSRFAQPAELPLQRYEGMVPLELLGRVPFPPIGQLPYFVTLAPYGFYWFHLVDQGARDQ